MRAITTDIILETTDYLVANLDNNGVRNGIKGFMFTDFPADQELDGLVAASYLSEMTEETLEDWLFVNKI